MMVTLVPILHWYCLGCVACWHLGFVELVLPQHVSTCIFRTFQASNIRHWASLQITKKLFALSSTVVFLPSEGHYLQHKQQRKQHSTWLAALFFSPSLPSRPFAWTQLLQATASLDRLELNFEYGMMWDVGQNRAVGTRDLCCRCWQQTTFWLSGPLCHADAPTH